VQLRFIPGQLQPVPFATGERIETQGNELVRGGVVEPQHHLVLHKDMDAVFGALQALMAAAAQASDRYFLTLVGFQGQGRRLKGKSVR